MKTFVVFVTALFLAAFAAAGEKDDQPAALQEWVSELVVSTGYPIYIDSIAVSPMGGKLAWSESAGDYGKNGRTFPRSHRVSLREADGSVQGFKLESMPDTSVHGSVRDLAFSPDSSTLYATVSWRRTLVAWDVATGKLVAEFLKPQFPAEPGPADFFFNPVRTGTGLDLGGSEAKSTTTDQAPVVALAAINGGVRVVRMFGKDGGQIGSAVKLWEPRCLAFAPDGSFVAVASAKTDRPFVHVISWDGKKKDWAWRDFKVPQSVLDLAVSPDSSQIAVAMNKTNRVYVLDRKAGRKVAELKGHTGVVGCVRYLPDGLLATGSVGNDGETVIDESTVRIWDVARQQCLAVLDQRLDVPTGVVEIASGPYGKELYVACYNLRHGGFIKRWKRVTKDVVSVPAGSAAPATPEP